MARIHVETGEGESEDWTESEEEPRRRRKRSGATHVDVEIEREITKRQLVESLTSILVVVLYMAFTLLRERESGVIVLDDEGDYGSEDDWVE
jgi:hypothetical protein